MPAEVIMDRCPIYTNVWIVQKQNWLTVGCIYLVHKRAHKVNETTLHLRKFIWLVPVHHGLRKDSKDKYFHSDTRFIITMQPTFLKAKLISTNLQWVVGLAQSSPGLPAPRIQLPPWEPPSENSVFRLKERLVTQCWKILAMNNQSCTYFALDLPWLGNGRQVTSSHHHCPVWNQTHVFKQSIQCVLK